MEIVTIDVLDGNAPVQVAVHGLIDANRLRSFVADSHEALRESNEEAEWYEELNRGYAQDRI